MLFAAAGRSGRDARGLFHDRKADAGLVTVLFGNRTPGILGFLAGRERTLHLGRAFHELVEVHRSELAADHPEIALRHGRLLLFRYSAAIDIRDNALRNVLRTKR